MLTGHRAVTTNVVVFLVMTPCIQLGGPKSTFLEVLFSGHTAVS